MTDFTFNSATSIVNAVSGIKITNVTRPTRPARERNKVVIPGVNGTYDFGNNRKEDFIITIEIVIIGISASDLQTKVKALSSYLDGKGNLIFTDDLSTTYTAQVYDEVVLTGDATAKWARGLIVFECDSAGGA